MMLSLTAEPDGFDYDLMPVISDPFAIELSDHESCTKCKRRAYKGEELYDTLMEDGSAETFCEDCFDEYLEEEGLEPYQVAYYKFKAE